MGSPRPVTVIILLLATIAAGVSGSLLSDRLAPHIPGGYITLGILGVVTVIATLAVLLLSGNESPENLSAIRRRMSDTLGVVSALSMISLVFWIFVEYSPGWARAIFPESAFNGEWAGTLRQQGGSRDLASSFEAETSDGDLSGTLTAEGLVKCVWAVTDDFVTPDETELLFATGTKETGPAQCPEKLEVHLDVLSDRRISVEASGNVIMNGREWDTKFSGTLRPKGAAN
ncbi:hypothetical protein ABZ079_33295 [Streptomyces sp. NPDC006314]|uniref:hypothetical protein n=1 Tax=Streptomyces sp. NPDC006314 TaxID=3154475 RepID=UPI0033A568C7